jgi:hypothetical protein
VKQVDDVPDLELASQHQRMVGQTILLGMSGLRNASSQVQKHGTHLESPLYLFMMGMARIQHWK